MEPKEYILKDDLDLKENLDLIDIMNKIINEVVLKNCNDAADEVLKEN